MMVMKMVLTKVNTVIGPSQGRPTSTYRGQAQDTRWGASKAGVEKEVDVAEARWTVVPRASSDEAEQS
jgi:hypothetical protein